LLDTTRSDWARCPSATSRVWRRPPPGGRGQPARSTGTRLPSALAVGVGEALVGGSTRRGLRRIRFQRSSQPIRSAYLVGLPGAVLIASVSACSGPAPYNGPGTDHEFVGRSIEEITPCSEPMCGIGGVNNGTLDGVVVRVVRDVSEDELAFGDAACIIGRVDLVVDGTEIVAATESC
jgi:hypothetical protein